MTEPKSDCRIYNVSIPLMLDDTFIPPDLERAIEYYPHFRRFSGMDLSVQGYTCAILKQIDLKKPNGYDGDKAFQELVHHIGFNGIARLFRVKPCKAQETNER